MRLDRLLLPFTLSISMGWQSANAQDYRSTDLNRRTAAAANNKGEMVYHGKVIRPDNSLLKGEFQVTFRLYSPPPTSCLLWAESQMVVFTNGGFSASIGKASNRLAGASAGGSAADFESAFLNNTTLTFSGSACEQGATYTPAVTDSRFMDAIIHDGVNLVEVRAVPIKSVPYAMHSELIGGYRIQNLMKISGTSSVVFTPEETQSLKDLLGNELDWDMKDRRMTNVADPTAATDAATRGWVEALTASSTGSRPQNQVYASPVAGAGVAAFRLLDPSDIPVLDSSKITTGVLSVGLIPDLDSAKITTGVLDVARIPDLDSAKITTGVLGVARIPDLDAAKITTGTLGVARIPDLDAAKITTGTLGVARIPDLDAAKITTGTLGVARIPDLDAAKITTGVLDVARIPDLDAAKVTTGILPVVRGGTGTATGSITGTGALTFAAGGVNSNITLTPSGTAYTLLNGNVGIGISTPSEKLEVVGNVRATNFVATSDRRLKANVKSIPDGLEIIRKLTGYSYNWKATGEGDYGVIAQEVEAVMPNAVRTDYVSGIKAVKYNNLTAPMIQSIKQLDTANAELQEKVKTLSDENRELRSRLDQLENLVQKLSADRQ